MQQVKAVTISGTAELASPVGGRIPGNRGIWTGILIEMTEFALLFCVYFIARAHSPEAFQEGPARLNTLAGTANTIMMISGSYFVARAVLAVRENHRKASIGWLLLVLAAACGYVLIKSYELRWNAGHGITGRTGIFYTVYYYLTFTHMVHVGWGMIGLFWVLVRSGMGAYTPDAFEGVEAFASYWHATDLVWLIIFPLVYLLR